MLLITVLTFPKFCRYTQEQLSNSCVTSFMQTWLPWRRTGDMWWTTIQQSNKYMRRRRFTVLASYLRIFRPGSDYRVHSSVCCVMKNFCDRCNVKTTCFAWCPNVSGRKGVRQCSIIQPMHCIVGLLLRISDVQSCTFHDPRCKFSCTPYVRWWW
jgi:hypothetical protein